MKKNIYANGKIYCIRNSVDDEVYVGSTTCKLHQRMAKHRWSYRHDEHKRDNYLLYQHFAKLGLEKFYLELIEDYPCENVEQLLRREGEVIRQMGTLNKIVAGRTDKEYYDEHKEQNAINCRQYREAHKEELKQYRQKRYLENKEELAEKRSKYREENRDHILKKKREHHHANKERLNNISREYYEKNKEARLEYQRMYKENNKDKIAARRIMKTVCECGCEIGRQQMARHKRTLKHEQLMQTKEIIT